MQQRSRRNAERRTLSHWLGEVWVDVCNLCGLLLLYAHVVLIRYLTTGYVTGFACYWSIVPRVSCRPTIILTALGRRLRGCTTYCSPSMTLLPVIGFPIQQSE